MAQILVVTYTRAATAELRERIRERLEALRREVRALVRRIVDQTLDAGAASPAAAPADGRTVVAICGDHGGWRMKDAIGTWLEEQGYAVRDCGTHSDDAVDYPDLAQAVARLVADGTAKWGICVDGAGIGSARPSGRGSPSRSRPSMFGGGSGKTAWPRCWRSPPCWAKSASTFCW